MDDEAKKKPRKIKPYGPKWERLADAVARGFAPSLYPCAKCGYPVLSGYCCSGCQTSDPHSAS